MLTAQRVCVCMKKRLKIELAGRCEKYRNRKKNDFASKGLQPTALAFVEVDAA